MRHALRVFLVIVTSTSAIAHADPAASLPEQPSRTHVIAAMNAVIPAVGACGDGGTVLASITFRPDGRVVSVRVRGVVGGEPVDGTPLGACVAAAARTAVVPPFRRESFVVNFPFRL